MGSKVRLVRVGIGVIGVHVTHLSMVHEDHVHPDQLHIVHALDTCIDLQSLCVFVHALIILHLCRVEHEAQLAKWVWSSPIQTKQTTLVCCASCPTAHIAGKLKHRTLNG